MQILSTLLIQTTLVATLASFSVSVIAEEPLNSPTEKVFSKLEHNTVDVSSPDALNNNILDLSQEDLPEELEEWKTPDDLVQNYVYYLSGFDYEDCPIWVTEMGKYDMRKVVAGGAKSMEAFDNYTRQAALRMYKSHKLRDPTNNRISYIVDFEGLKLQQLTNLQTVTYILKLAREWGKALGQTSHIVIVVNANYITELLINLVKPAFGGVLSNTEVFGSNRERWIPHVLKAFPKDQIPEWYGGYKGFTPIKIYG